MLQVYSSFLYKIYYKKKKKYIFYKNYNSIKNTENFSRFMR